MINLTGVDVDFGKQNDDVNSITSMYRAQM